MLCQKDDFNHNRYSPEKMIWSGVPVAGREKLLPIYS
jgi:hypothetical protein